MKSSKWDAGWTFCMAEGAPGTPNLHMKNARKKDTSNISRSSNSAPQKARRAAGKALDQQTLSPTSADMFESELLKCIYSKIQKGNLGDVKAQQLQLRSLAGHLLELYEGLLEFQGDSDGSTRLGARIDAHNVRNAIGELCLFYIINFCDLAEMDSLDPFVEDDERYIGNPYGASDPGYD